MAEVYVETKTHPVCPGCGSKTGVGTIDHLRDRKDFVTSWSCRDCGKCIHIHLIDGILQECRVDPQEHWVKGVAVLKLDPQDHPIYFVVEHRDYRPRSGEQETEEDRHSHRQFLFEEHSCPTNWLKPILVLDKDDSDPHGLIQYVGWREIDPEAGEYHERQDRILAVIKEVTHG